MHYSKVKRAKIDRCSICGEEKSLSWDHVPPKGSLELTPVEMETIFQVFTGDRENRKVRESQNGVKYRTLCNECNSTLGLHYDPSIKEFAESVGRYLNSDLAFPEVVGHRTKPNAIMRGILGHLLAANADFGETTFDVDVREFLFDHSAPIPHGIYIHYWLYPYSQIVVMRDFCMPSVRGKFSSKPGFFHTLKYFPIAYLVSNLRQYENLYELTQYRHIDVEEEVDLPIRLNRVEHQFWPEIVDDGNMLFGGQSMASSVSANPRLRKPLK